MRSLTLSILKGMRSRLLQAKPLHLHSGIRFSMTPSFRSLLAAKPSWTWLLTRRKALSTRFQETGILLGYSPEMEYFMRQDF